METLEIIKERKSVRKFQDLPLKREDIASILSAGNEAPSVKNSQPWKYYVVEGEPKNKLVKQMEAGIMSFATEEKVKQLPFYKSVCFTIEVMKQAPTIVLVFHTGKSSLESGDTLEAKFMDCGVMQTMGATIQNMLLAATQLGIGSLWICDVFYAYDYICNWLGEKNQLAAAVALGYEEGKTSKASKRNFEDSVIYMSE